MKMQAESPLKSGERITEISITVLVALGILIFSVGLLSNSVAMRADGIHTLADAFVSVIVLIGLKLLKKNPSERFQFGYYKTETFASMIVAIFLTALGAWFLYSSYMSFISPRALDFPLVALLVSLLSAISFYVLAIYKGRVAKRLGSLSLKTDAKNSIKTGMASSIVFIGLAFSYMGFHQVESIAGMIISIFIFVVSYGAIKESSLILLDGCSCKGVRGNIKEIAESVKGVKEVHEVLLRQSGPYVMGEMHIKVDGKLSVYAANEIVEKIENKAMKQMPVLKRLTVKVEPLRKRN